MITFVTVDLCLLQINTKVNGMLQNIRERDECCCFCHLKEILPGFRDGSERGASRGGGVIRIPYMR
jgi:hypothetical protein